jgi:mRNA interferase MazF
MKQKDIVLLPFPFTNLEESKVRPALIVSNDSFNKRSDDCIMVPLTTVIEDAPYSIIIDQEDMSSGRLLKPSMVKIDKVFTVEKKLVVMKIGSVNDATFKKIKNKLLEIF